MISPLLIDGFGPLSVHQPKNTAELGDLIRDSAARNQAVYPVGGGTSLDLGLPPTKAGIAVSTLNLNAIDDYPARDMTITVGAGMTFAQLQATLAQEKQYLPLEVPHTQQATLGGAIATNKSGPRRYGHGTLRDFIIGIQFVSDEGVEVRGGGRVVKNVAGYDLMKLHIGALGTLGVITQITLKVKPRPESQGLVAFGLNEAALGPTLERLHASQSRPAILEVLNANAAKQLAKSFALPSAESWVMMCGFEEKATTVKWQMQTLLGELAGAPVREVQQKTGPEVEEVISALVQLQAGESGCATLKANVRPSMTAGFAAFAASLHSEARVHLHAGNGIVFVHIPVENTPDRLSGIAAELSKRATDANANLVVERCPTAWKNFLPIWGHRLSTQDLARTIRSTLDPQGIFNPGRLG